MPKPSQASSFPDNGLGLSDSSGVLADWRTLERKMAHVWRARQDGDVRAVLASWRAAERASNEQRNGPEAQTFRKRAAALRAEYHRLFAAATGASPKGRPTRQI
jgi:hypothetical protein